MEQPLRLHTPTKPKVTDKVTRKQVTHLLRVDPEHTSACTAQMHSSPRTATNPVRRNLSDSSLTPSFLGLHEGLRANAQEKSRHLSKTQELFGDVRDAMIHVLTA